MGNSLLAQHQGLAEIAISFNAMGNMMLAQSLPAPFKNQTAHVRTQSQDPSFVLQYVSKQDKRQRNSALSTALPGWTINKTARLRTCVPAHRHKLWWAGTVPTCVASCQQSTTVMYLHAFLGERCHSGYLCCLPSTTGPGHVSARMLRRSRAGTVPAGKGAVRKRHGIREYATQKNGFHWNLDSMM